MFSGLDFPGLEITFWKLGNLIQYIKVFPNSGIPHSAKKNEMKVIVHPNMKILS